MIKLIVMDVDGTLTDGKIYYSENNDEYKSFNVKDGLIIKEVRKRGVLTSIITGRESNIVLRRGKELDIDYIFQNKSNKLETLEKLLSEINMSFDEVLYIGDDLNDYDCMIKCGYRACPNDAAEEIKMIASYISAKNGGEGAVREIIDRLITK